MAVAALLPSAADVLSEADCDTELTELKPFDHGDLKSNNWSDITDILNNDFDIGFHTGEWGIVNLNSYTEKIRRLSSSNSYSSSGSELSDIVAQLQGSEVLGYLEPLFPDHTDGKQRSFIDFDNDDNDSVMLEYDDLAFLDDDDSREEDRCSQSIDFYPPEISATDASYQKTNLPTFGHLVRSLTSRPIIPPEKPHRSDIEDLSDEMRSEDEEEYVIKKSKRGAKNILLWKFLLQQLDTRPDLVKWVNRKEGSFRFVDTHVVSHLWGEEKRKKDMNFEKLSRGIRHYYRSGLMSRQGGTRLVYKFNWKKVPPQYRRK